MMSAKYDGPFHLVEFSTVEMEILHGLLEKLKLNMLDNSNGSRSSYLTACFLELPNEAVCGGFLSLHRKVSDSHNGISPALRIEGGDE